LPWRFAAETILATARTDENNINARRGGNLINLSERLCVFDNGHHKHVLIGKIVVPLCGGPAELSQCGTRTA
jgi:hypothetical protein